MDCIAKVLAAYGPHAYDDRYDPVAPRKSVTAALVAGEITRRQADILSVLGPRAQDIAVDQILNGRARLSEAEMCEAIELRAKPLEDACFDGKDCAECRYNSDVQATQGFDFLPQGLCVNKICFEAKEAEELEARADEMRGRYRVVRIAVDPRSRSPEWRKVDADGDEGVGSAQQEECVKKCPRFGAVIEGGSFRTTTHTNVCTDPACHSTKAQTALAQAQARKRESIWRHALGRHALRLGGRERATAFLVAMELGGSVGATWQAKYGRSGAESSFAYKQRYDRGPTSAIREATQQLMLSVIVNVPANKLGHMLLALGVRIQEHWCLTPAFLEVFSLPELREIALDLGLHSPELVDIEPKGRLAYAKALGQAITTELVMGFVPKALRP